MTFLGVKIGGNEVLKDLTRGPFRGGGVWGIREEWGGPQEWIFFPPEFQKVAAVKRGEKKGQKCGKKEGTLLRISSPHYHRGNAEHLKRPND